MDRGRRRTGRERRGLAIAAAASLLGAVLIADGGSQAAAAAPSAVQVLPAIGLDLDAMSLAVQFGGQFNGASVTALLGPGEGQTTQVEAGPVAFARGADNGMFAVGFPDGRSYTVFVPPASDGDERDFGLAYVYAEDATTLAWNTRAWPAGATVSLEGTALPADLAAGSLTIPGLTPGAVVQLVEPLSGAFRAFADRVADAMPDGDAVPTLQDRLALDAALATAPSTEPEVTNATVLGIVPSPQQFVTADDVVACADIPAADPTGQCPVEAAQPAASGDIWRPDFTNTAAVAVPVGNVIMTRPVFKSFIPSPRLLAPLGTCDFGKALEVYEGDGRPPGVDQPSARTTAFWDLSWGPNSGVFLQRIGATTRVRSIDFAGRETGPETRIQSLDTIQGSPGNHYVTGAGQVEGFREVRFRVASANPFCSLPGALAIDQNNGQVGGASALFANRPPFWQKDGSMGTGFRHDQFPAHEYYNYSYLPGLRVTNPVQYYSPPNAFLGPVCLAASRICPQMRVDIVSP